MNINELADYQRSCWASKTAELDGDLHVSTRVIIAESSINATLIIL